MPGLKKNLLSISALDEKGMRVAFIYGQVIMWPKGKISDDAIVISEQALVHDTVEPNEIWHRRLAHVHYRALPIASKAVEGLPEFQAKDVRKERIRRRHFQAAKAKPKAF